MAGLLDTFFGSPDQTQALGLLGIGMMRGGFGDGAAMAMQHLAGADDRKMRKGLLEMQIEETRAQAEERKAKLEAARLNQERQDRLLFGGDGVSQGAFAPSADGFGPTMPQGSAPPAGGLVGFARSLGIPEQAIQADIAFNGGKKIAELLASRSAPNWQNVNGNLVNTNAPGFQGGFQPGMAASNDGRVTMWQPDGRGGLVVGAPRGAVETYSAYQNVGEGTKAAYDPVQVVGPDGAARYVPRSTVVGRGPAQARAPAPAIGGESDRFAILSQELARAEASGNKADAQALRNEIARLPASARVGANPSGLSVPGFQATPTTAQAAEAAGAKVRAESDAKAESERQAGKTKKSDSATDMLGTIQRARELLDLEPTGSVGGAFIDKAMGAVGMTTAGSNAATALETLSGWLVSNTPRMEGPQSNIDVENYKVMAGRIGDRTVPVAARRAALAEVERIQRKYAHLNSGDQPARVEPQGSWEPTGKSSTMSSGGWSAVRKK